MYLLVCVCAARAHKVKFTVAHPAAASILLRQFSLLGEHGPGSSREGGAAIRMRHYVFFLGLMDNRVHIFASGIYRIVPVQRAAKYFT